MKDFIQFLVTSLVKNPQNVVVKESGEGTNFRYKVTVDPTDIGLVIGKQGNTINSIRSLAKARALKEGIWVNVELEDYGQTKTAQTKTENDKTNQAGGNEQESLPNDAQKESTNPNKDSNSDDPQLEDA